MIRLPSGVLLIAPAVLVVGLLLVLSTAIVVDQSLYDFGGERSFAYRELFSDPEFAVSMLLSLGIAAASTLLSVTLGILTALAFRRIPRPGPFLLFSYQLPVTVPYVVVAVAALFLLGQSGLLARLAASIGLIQAPADFPALVYDRAGIGIILVYAWKQVPFVGLIALSVLQARGEDYGWVARSLGARPVQAFFRVQLPLLLPSLMPAAVIIFAYSFGAFEVPLLLGRRFPAMVSVYAYRLYTDANIKLRPQAMAASLVIGLVSLILLLAYRRLAREPRL